MTDKDKMPQSNERSAGDKYEYEGRSQSKNVNRNIVHEQQRNLAKKNKLKTENESRPQDQKNLNSGKFKSHVYTTMKEVRFPEEKEALVQIKPGTVEADENHELEEEAKRVMDCKTLEELKHLNDGLMKKFDELIKRQEDEPDLNFCDALEDLGTVLDLAIERKKSLEKAELERREQEARQQASRFSRVPAENHEEGMQVDAPSESGPCETELERLICDHVLSEKKCDIVICFKFLGSRINFDQSLILRDVECLVRSFKSIRVLICHNYKSQVFKASGFLDFDIDFSGTIPFNELKQEFLKSLLNADWRNDSIRIFTVVHEDQYSDLLTSLTNPDTMRHFNSFNISIQNYMVYSSKNHQNKFSASIHQLADCRSLLEKEFIGGMLSFLQPVFYRNVLFRLKRVILKSRLDFDNYRSQPMIDSKNYSFILRDNLEIEHKQRDKKDMFKPTGNYQTLCNTVTLFEFRTERMFSIFNRTLAWAEVLSSVVTADSLQNLHTMARKFADKFNEDLDEAARLLVSAVWYKRLEDHCFMLFNETMSNVHNCQLGPSHSDPSIKQLIHAFSHYTYQLSSGSMVVFDLRTLKNDQQYLLTEPVIFSKKFGQYTSADIGPRGLVHFTRKHRCNYFCYKLKLSRLN